MAERCRTIEVCQRARTYCITHSCTSGTLSKAKALPNRDLYPLSISSCANLTSVDLSHAVLGGAILRRADVTDADFEGVELATVTMDFANFSKARNAKIPSYKTNLR